MTHKKGNRKKGYFHYQKEILNTISEPASFINKNFKYVFVNTAFNNFYHAETQDIVGKPVHNLWGKENFDEKIKPALEKCINGEEVFLQYEGIIPNGDDRILKMNFYPHLVSSKRIDGIISTTTDITEQKKAEKELKQNENRLKKLNATKDKLFSIIGHDLKGPLNNILGFSELIDQGFDSFSDEEIKKYNRLIFQSSQTVTSLLDNLLTWSRSQRNKIKVSKQLFALNAVVQKNLSLLENNASKKSIQLKNEVPADIIANGDTEMVTTILRNLISNAIKFTNEGGEIKVVAKNSNNRIIVEIHDNGVGIPPDKINNLFEPDQTHVNLGTAGEKGTGLGLIICKDFAEKNDGELWAESEPGKGSVFSFSMPLKEIE